MDKPAFAHEVRDALIHLYDHVYLQDRPLAGLLASGSSYEIRGRSLHRVLLESIEALHPAVDVPPRSAAWRPYRVLFHRYVEALDTQQIAEQLAVSPRQVRREHSRGVDMVVDLLWQRCLGQVPDQAQPPFPAETEAGRPLLYAAVEKLGMTRPEGPTSVAEALDGALSIVARLAEARHVQFETRIPGDLPLSLIDRVVLRQVLLGVLTEILNWRVAGLVVVEAARAGKNIEVTFDCAACARQDPAILAAGEHLSVARHLLEMQGGHLAATVEAGQRALFRLSLPAQRAATVLVVDDDPDMVRLFQRYLGDGTYQVLTATSGQAALRVAMESQPQAVTLDVMMPSQDGWDVLQRLKNRPETQDIPVIVCSVLRERDLALSLGAAGFLAKPITQLALLAALAECGVAPVAEGHPDPPANNASARLSRDWSGV